MSKKDIQRDVVKALFDRSAFVDRPYSVYEECAQAVIDLIVNDMISKLQAEIKG